MRVEKYQQVLNESREKLKEMETKKQVELESKLNELDILKDIISDLSNKAMRALNKGRIITSCDLFNEIISKIYFFGRRL
jgi:hypothetical protein